MSQQIQELINKIKMEGVQEAEKQAAEIIAGAQKKAQAVLAQAQAQAERVKEEARQESERFQASARMTLKQAARDILLDVRQQINEILRKIVLHEMKAALSADKLANMIADLVKAYGQKGPGAVVNLNSKDAQALKTGFVEKLQKELKTSLTLSSADEIEAGFTISFDEGKSSYDFSDASLVAYLSRHVNEEISEILKGAQEG